MPARRGGSRARRRSVTLGIEARGSCSPRPLAAPRARRRQGAARCPASRAGPRSRGTRARRSAGAARSPRSPSRRAPAAPAPTRSTRRRRRRRSRGRRGRRARRSSSRIASASGVVGPFAPSSTILALTRPALASVITSSSAHGASTSQSSSSSSSFETASPPPSSDDRPPRCLVGEQRSDVEAARGRARPPLESETATTVAPASAANLANSEPTLPKPWIAIRQALERDPSARERLLRAQKKTPRPVASSRPSEPPIASGLPVTTLSTE